MNSQGNIVREKQVGAFRIVEKSYGGSVSLDKHQHPTAYLSFLLAGAYVEVSGWGEVICPSGTVIWHPPAETHSDRFHRQGGHLIDLEVRDTGLQDAAQSLRPATRSRTFCGGLPYAMGLRLYRELSVDGNQVEDVVIELLSFFFSVGVDRSPPLWLNRAIERVSNIDELQPSLTMVARDAGIHPVHLARSFRRFLGCTFGDYVAKVRVRRAFELLRDGRWPIVDVAYASGFADHAHLCRAFKSSTGLTPSAFRSVVGQPFGRSSRFLAG
jgi:AraC family transcriptional regulator